MFCWNKISEKGYPLSNEMLFVFEETTYSIFTACKESGTNKFTIYGYPFANYKITYWSYMNWNMYPEEYQITYKDDEN